jgi:cation diffusion facilitator family transporter
VSEAIHSGTDFVAALLTFFAVGVAVRPADVTHQYGHGKAENLAALAEATILVGASVLISVRAVERLTGATGTSVDAAWYALVTVAVVICVDASRATVSWRTARRYASAALASNALHFASDLAGSVAVLVGLLFARAGYPNGDPVAALFVGALVLIAAARLIKGNVDVLMDRAPTEAEAVARAAIGAVEPAVELRRLRMRQAAGRQFADVVIGVPPGAAVGQGHAAADAVEAAVERALPGSDVVVHVEPLEDAGVRERAHAATHLEPLTEPSEAREVDIDTASVERIVREATGAPPRELRFLRTDGGLVAFLTLGLDPQSRLDDAHMRASEIEERIRHARPDIADVIVHTEP